MKFKTMLLAATALTISARAFSADAMPIADALGKLDYENDAHWTADGLPRIDTLKSLTGDQSLTRDTVEQANPGFNRDKAAAAAQVVPPAPGQEPPNDPMAAALADGWAPHPTAPGYHYKGQDVTADADLAALYAPAPDETQPGDPNATDISAQTGTGGATTARSPEPVEGEPRKTHVSLSSEGEPGERPVGVAQGMTDAGVNKLGTPEGSVENAGRAIELSGEVQARAAGSVLTPSQAAADASNAEGISLGGAADPVVEARAPGGAVVAEDAPPATFFEGETVGGPFGNSGIRAGGGAGEAQLASVDVNFDGDPDKVTVLEAELETVSSQSNELRGQIDDLNAELAASLRTEAQLRRQIEANKPRAGNMTTIQTFLRLSHERRAAAAKK